MASYASMISMRKAAPDELDSKGECAARAKLTPLEKPAPRVPIPSRPLPEWWCASDKGQTPTEARPGRGSRLHFDAALAPQPDPNHTGVMPGINGYKVRHLWA